MRRILLFLLKAIISSSLILFLYRNTPLEQIGQALASMDFSYLPLIFIMLGCNTVISAYKWQLFLRADGVILRLRDLVISYMSGTFCNLFLPSNIGGDTYRVYDIARQSKQGTRTAASVFADRFSGFIALVSLSLISSVFVAGQFDSARVMLLPLGLFALFMLVLTLLIRQKPIRVLLEVSRLNRLGPVNGIAEKLLSSFACYGANTRLLMAVMALSFVFQISVIITIYLMAASLHATVPFYYFGAFIPLITLMEALPISIYGIGVRDYGYVFFFTQAGMTDIETRSLAVLFMAIVVCYSLLGGLFFLYKLWLNPARS